MKRTLSLRHETIADLTTDELGTLAGGSGAVCVDSGIPTRCMCTGYYPSLNAPCTTPVTPAISGSLCG